MPIMIAMRGPAASWLMLLITLVSISIASTATTPSSSSLSSTALTNKKQNRVLTKYAAAKAAKGGVDESKNTETVLLLDVDNTLYCESELGSKGIEAQIVQNIHKVCLLQYNITPEEADILHHDYGSTVEGLRQTLWKGYSSSALAERMKEWYDAVYDSIDVSALLASSTSTTTTTTTDSDSSEDSSGSPTSTGYTSQTQGSEQQHLLRRILQHTPHHEQLHLASNSPLRHVKKVVQAMGLTRVPWTDVWTPDRLDGDLLEEEQSTRMASSSSIPLSLSGMQDWTERNRRVYPTKVDPTVFFDSLFTDENDHMSEHQYRLKYVDDSPVNLLAATKISSSKKGSGSTKTPKITAVQVTPDRPVQQALAVANDWIRDNAETYQFSQVNYLKSKNVVDYNSMNRETWRQVSDELIAMLSLNRKSAKGKTLCIVDVGAGLLSMLRLVVQGHGHELPSLLSLVQEQEELNFVDFYAYEPNHALREACQEELERLGFVLQEVFNWDSSSALNAESFDPELVFIREPALADDDGLPPIVVHLRMFDYEHHRKRPQPTPHLIVGSSFADLMEPYELTKSLMRRFASSSPSETHSETLLYFPITFRGTTQFLPACPMEQLDADSPIIPSDTIAFKLYAKALRELQRHNLDPLLLEEAMGDFGAVFLSSGRSDWIIDADDHSYLWETMLYFFGTLAAPQLRVAGWNDQEWLARARYHRPTIAASNVDLLFRMPHLGRWEPKEPIGGSAFGLDTSFEEIQFTAPYQVRTIPKQFVKLGPNEVRVRSVCSLISSGTELKIFKGIFEDAPLDVNIKGMEEERMAYPLAFGYSLVGHVVECGANVEDADSLIGKLVFTFSPHASQVVTDRAGIHIVPDGIDALDAIFMPSVETALSIVHDAHPRMGDKIGVFGQGVIGLLVTTLLARLGINEETFASTFGLVTTFDTLPERLAVSSTMGSSQALLPSEVAAAGPFDVTIEVSGAGAALQAAIDSTREGGRIVIGSWYGNTDVRLHLGIDFHRSHKTLITSQVSELPAELTATWSKERRFAYTWDLVRQIRPSRLITKKTTLDKAQDAYISLDDGAEIAAVFEY